jgi:hypothetical protein
MKNRYATILRITVSCHEINLSQCLLNGLKLRRQLLVLTLFVSSPCGYAQGTIDRAVNQDSYIVNAAVYNKGIYRTFDEFKHNSPSITDHYIIEKGQIWMTYDSGNKRKVKKSEVWGYCTGDKIFVRTRMYNQVLELGRYCYFRNQGKSQLYGTHSNNMMFGGSYKERMIIDFNTGKMKRLTATLMKQRFETDDPDLLTEFMAEPSKGKELYKYLMKYNQRNMAKIK